MNSNQQLLPGFALRDWADFAGFYAPDGLRMVKATLQQLVDENLADFVYLSGANGTGKSHLLQAVCNRASDLGRSAIYFSLADVREYPPAAILESTGEAACLCLDDVDAIAGNDAWEEALFHLFNQRRAAHLPTCFAAVVPARQLPLRLADLQSRLALCLSFQLPILSDAEKTALVQYRAREHGIEISDSCASFIIQRSGRSIAALVELLEKLDKESLAAQRKITIPFIKSVCGW